MTFIVEMVRGKPDQDDFQTYDMDLWTWRTLLDFGKANGWAATGTFPDERYSVTDPEYMQHFKNDYSPKEWSMCKRFDSDDASSLAKALKLGISKALEGKIPPPVRNGPSLLNTDSGYVSPYISKNPYLKEADEFSNFLIGGSFIFAFDD